MSCEAQQAKTVLEKLLFAKEQQEKECSNTTVAKGCPLTGLTTKTDLKSHVRVGGVKGRTGNTDFTAGKRAFVRPCTVGWKSQNQPLQRGGGNRRPL